MHFGQKKESTDPVEQRLDKIEAILPYLVRDSEHDKVCKQVLSMDKYTNQIADFVKQGAEVAGRTNENCTAISDQLLKYIEMTNRFKDTLYQEVELHRNITQDLRERIRATQDYIGSAMQAVTDFKSILNLHEELLKVDGDEIEELKTNFSTLKDDVLSLRAALSIQMSQMASLKEVNATLKADNEYIRRKCQEIIEKFNANQETTDEQIDDVIQTFNSQLNNVSKTFQRQFDEFSEIVIPNEESLLKKANEAIELVGLDAKNACIRSANTETKLVMMGKQIENIKLLLHRHELDK